MSPVFICVLGLAADALFLAVLAVLPAPPPASRARRRRRRRLCSSVHAPPRSRLWLLTAHHHLPPRADYNDVYTIEPGSDKSAGAARFASKLKSFSAEKPLVLFSGDAFNPSAMSTITKGKHMVPVLNDLGTHVSVMGNHGAWAGAPPPPPPLPPSPPLPPPITNYDERV